MLGLNVPLKQCIFGLYVGLWVASHLLVYSSQHAGAPAYNATSVVLLTELTKLFLAVGLYLAQDGSAKTLLKTALGESQLLIRYAVPALLYCVYNNLVYVNLSSFDPGTYNVLMQMKIGLTGVLYQCIFSKRLNRNQWLAILLITLGCMCKESRKLTSGSGLTANLFSWILLLCQMLASVSAGIYNELLLKGKGSNREGVTTNLQNVFMYLQSVLWNGALLLAKGQLGDALSVENVSAILTPRLLAIVAIMSSVGIVTGFFLKHLDSVLKSIAAALEVVFTMILGCLLFGTPLDALSVVAVLLVGGGVAMYARPVAPPSGRELELSMLPKEV
ncbi:unnamed protein product [Polarella glacialis]|uniref:CMP-sialic acid transporter n=2 Tax=Polarella glacialis TaxID=89957 RepID=A0A813L7V3_POLGL|nr:unnamed protein product [Polarella glacialis]CAE8722422.1 unnamed protein product [Polarella glacialis]